MTTIARQVVIIAKAPEPGNCKTRLVGALSPSEAAWIAEACLRDTIRTAASVPDCAIVLAIEGTWSPSPDFTKSCNNVIVRQRGEGLAERIENALADAWDVRPVPTVLIVADSPQMTSEQIADLFDAFEDGSDSAIGPARDGGFWALGMTVVEPAVVRDVPMSVSSTGASVMRRLRERGGSVFEADVLRDVDTFEDAAIIRVLCPDDSEFGRTWDAVLRRVDRRTERFHVTPSPT